MNKKQPKTSMRGKQGRKDSRSKRVNFDNARDDKVMEEVAKGMKSTDKSNDVSWYAHNPELLRAAASIPFSATTGTALGWTKAGAGNQTVPGVLSMTLLPTIGGWNDDAVNSAKESIYSYVVHANSRNTSYNSTDLMLVILAGSNVFVALANAIRAYGIMKLYDQRNKYLPHALIKACGFDHADLQANLSNMWFDINEMIARASQIWIPNNLPFLDRWFWLNSNVYMDSESVKGQYYMMTTEMYWGYNETLNTQGGGLSWMKPDGTLLTSGSTETAYKNTGSNTWTSFRTMMNGMFDLLLNSEDRGVIMGDILKAYGADRIYAIKPIPADYTVVPVYDREVLTQIENADVFTQPYFSIKQNQSTLSLETDWGIWTFNPTVNALIPGQSILNFHQKEVPTPAQVMVATRLKVGGSHPIGQVSDSTKLAAISPNTMGTEYVHSMRAMYYQADGTLIVKALQMKIADSTSLDTQDMYNLMAFDWAPWLYRVTGTAPTIGSSIASFTQPNVIQAFGDYDMYTVIDEETLRKMHTTAVYSEFGVPTIG